MPTTSSRTTALSDDSSMAHGTTVAVSLVHMFIDLLPPEDRDLERLYALAGITAEDVSSPDKRVPKRAMYTLVGELLERLAEGKEDSELVMLAHQSIHPGMLQIVGYLMMDSNTLMEALQRLARYAPLLDDSLSISLGEEAGGCRLTFHADDLQPRPRVLQDMMAAGLLGFLRMLRGGKPLRVWEVAMTYDAPNPRILAMARQRHIRLTCGAHANSLVLERTQLDDPLLPSSPLLSEIHMRVADFKLEELRANSPVYLRVRQLIMERLQQQPPTIEDIAGLLHMTPRSLQRSLQADGWQYRQLLTEVRRDMTRLYLCHTSYSIKEVAYRLGFRELSSFHRFCMRWFGLTPLQLRKAEGKPVARLSDELGLADTVPE